MSAISHAFVSPKPDGADTSLVRPINWNAFHKIAYLVQNIVGADTIVVTNDVVRLQAGTYAVVVPLATGSGKQIYVCQDGAGTITLTRSGADTIGGLTSYALMAVGAACVLIDEASGIWGLLGSSKGTIIDTIYTTQAPGGIDVTAMACGRTIVTNSYDLVLASDNSALLRS
jgi:hypothetical protein